MDRRTQVLGLAEEKGLIRASDLEKEGIPRNYLFMLKAENRLERVARGVYALPDSDVNEYIELSEVSKRVPKAVIALISALHFHDLTTEIPNQVWICMPRGSWIPEIEYPSLNVTHVSGKAYTYGAEDHELNGVKVRIYNVAKTIADCFKFRNKVGLDVAIEAMQEALGSRKVTPSQIHEAAQTDRVARIIRPYLEAMV